MIIVQIIQAIWAGMKIGFQAFFSVLPLYNELSSLKDQLIASALGIPVIVIGTLGIIIAIVKFVLKRLAR